MADDKDLIDQSEIEQLLAQGPGKKPAKPAAPAAGGDALNQDEIEALLAGGTPSPAPKTAAVSATASAVEDADKLLSQNDIESLLQGQSSPGDPASGVAAAGPARPPGGAAPLSATGGDGETLFPGEGRMPSQDVEYLLNQAEEALRSIVTEQEELPADVLEFQLPEFGGAVPNTDAATLDLLSEVELDVKIELGRANMFLEDVLKLRKGSVVPLDKLAGDPVDIFVNGRLVARGEVLVMNDNFCVRVAELVASSSPAD